MSQRSQWNDESIPEDPKYGLFACIWVCTLSERPTMLFAVWPWFLHAFPQLFFRLISDKFRQFFGCNRWPYHGLSRSVTVFSDNAQDLSIVFIFCHGLSRLVTQLLGNLKRIWTVFRCNIISDYHISTMHALFAIIRNDVISCMHFRFDPIYVHGSSGHKRLCFRRFQTYFRCLECPLVWGCLSVTFDVQDGAL